MDTVNICSIASQPDSNTPKFILLKCVVMVSAVVLLSGAVITSVNSDYKIQPQNTVKQDKATIPKTLSEPPPVIIKKLQKLIKKDQKPIIAYKITSAMVASIEIGLFLIIV